MKRIVRLFIMLAMVLVVGNTAYAYDPSLCQPDNVEANASNPLAWHQSVQTEAGDCPKGASAYNVGGPDRTLGEMGCSYFATSYMLVKMGLEDPSAGFTPLDFCDKAKGKCQTADEKKYVEFSKLNVLYPKITCKNDKSAIGGSVEEQIATIKDYFNQGYFIIACVLSSQTAGHYIFIDGFDESGDMIIGDSARKINKWSDTYAKTDGKISDISIFSCEGVKANEQPSIYEGVNLNNAEPTKEEQAMADKIISEWDLNGMPKQSTLMANQDPIYLEDGETFEMREKNTLANIQSSIEDRHLTVTKVINTLISFIGIVLCVYSILLFIAGVFDTTNNWIETSVVQRLTFGRCRVLDETDASNLKVKKGDYSMKQFGLRCTIIFIIGIVCISHVIQNLVMLIFSHLMK